MKKNIIVWLLLFSSLVFAKEQSIYTIKGKKDPRLTAKYIASYISTSTSEECTALKPTTGTKRPAIGRKVYEVTDGNYSIDIPIYLKEDEDNCGYEFRRIELSMRRLYDDDLYSLHIILDKTQKASAIYYGDKGGIRGGTGPLMPSKLITDKKHYRIANDTKFYCKTEWYPRLNKSKSSKPVWYTKGSKNKGVSIFYCTMQIKDGQGNNMFQKVGKYSMVTHSTFGVDKIESDTLYVDIFVDDEGCVKHTGKETVRDHFREIIKPKATLQNDWDSIKNTLKKLFN